MRHDAPVSSGQPIIPTLDEVARLAGVSRSTASRAINGGLRVSPEAKAAVDEAVARLGFTPNRAARSLATRRNDSIALVVPEPGERILTDPFLGEILRGVNAALAPTDLQLVMLMSRPGEHSTRVARYLHSGHVDGVIIASHHRGDGSEAAVRASGLPAVYVGRPFDAECDLAFVDVDNFGGSRLAARRLIETGRRVLGTVAGPQDMSAGQDRLSGWLSELSAADMRTDLVEHGDFTSASGATAMERLLGECPELDGVFVASDLMAEGALGVLEAHGRRCPEDVAVVGFDNLGPAQKSRPPLTTVENPARQAVETATHMLLTMIGGRAPQSSRVILPARLVVRASA